MKKIIAFCDVDGTLYRADEAAAIDAKLLDQGVGHSFTDHYPLREDLVHFITCSQPFIDWYCWSGGGASYAGSFCRQKKIDHLFKGFYGKFDGDLIPVQPTFVVDDENIAMDFRALTRMPDKIIVPGGYASSRPREKQESGHYADCTWELANCEYKATHLYCPHKEHACDCTDDL